MTTTSAAPAAGPPPPVRLDPPALRRRALRNVLRAGHCAPTVMKTLLDATGVEASWPLKLVAGLPGIGNTGNECGALTAPLVVLGLRHAHDPDEDGVPVAWAKGRALVQDFERCHGSCACRDILVGGRLPLRCLGVVRRAPQRFVDVERASADGLTPGVRRAYARLHAHLVARDFHCAHAVIRGVQGDEPDPALLDATSAFVAGTACAGMTCSALTAGVMLLGLAHAEGEHGSGRVLRAMAGMATGGLAFAGDVRAVNGPMDEGHELATWFERAFGATRCRELVDADLTTEEGVLEYVEADRVTHCRGIARDVATRTRELIERR